MEWLDLLFKPQVRKGHYDRQKLASNNMLVDSEILEYIYISDISYNAFSKYLAFVIRRYRRQPKITRYVTINYNRTPIYGAYSERTKILLKFNRIINPAYFVNIELWSMLNEYRKTIDSETMDDKSLIELFNTIGIQPKWLVKLEQIKTLTSKIEALKKILREYNLGFNRLPWAPIYLCVSPGNFWLRFIIAFFTLGFSFVGFTSKSKALQNAVINKNKFQEHQIKIKEINHQNQKIKIKINAYKKNVITKINKLELDLKILKKTTITFVEVTADGWLNLRQAVNFPETHIQKLKGVYIIWNQTRDKYYVGQSPNLFDCIYNNHFKNGDVKSTFFKQDWNDGDAFLFKYFILQTKTEINRCEQMMVERYNSYNSGYNKRALIPFWKPNCIYHR